MSKMGVPSRFRLACRSQIPKAAMRARSRRSRDGAIQRELGLENDAPLQMRRQKAVAWNAELLGKVGANMRDGFHAAGSPVMLVTSDVLSVPSYPIRECD